MVLGFTLLEKLAAEKVIADGASMFDIGFWELHTDGGTKAVQGVIGIL